MISKESSLSIWRECFEMDTQLRALVAVHPQGKDVLIGKKLKQLTPDGRLQWCWPVKRDNTGNAFYVQLEDHSEYPFPVPFDYLEIGIGEREADDPLILLLQAQGQNVTPFLSRPASAPAPLKVPPAVA
jgi:hypothetical protein